jgi:hypothetical protein
MVHHNGSTDKKIKMEAVMNDDDDNIQSGGSEKQILLAQRAEIVRILHTIRKNLNTHNQPVIEEKPYSGSNHQSPALFSSVENKFTHRGRERALCLFTKFSNSKGTLGYFDFRSYLESVGRPEEFHPHILKSKESWCCYMHDLVGLDESGNLNHDNFIRYREGIENIYPLEIDLVRVGIGVLPQRLADWKKYNNAFVKIAKDNKTHHEDDTTLLCIPVEEMQYLAFCSGELIPLSTCKWLHLLNCRHNVVMRDVRAHFKKHNRFSSHATILFDPLDADNIFFGPMTGLWFSNRPRRVLREFHEKALRVKLLFSAWMRKTSDMFSAFADKFRSIVDLGYLIPAIIARDKAEVGRYGFSLEVGEMDGAEDGFGANITLSRIKNAARCFAEMGLAAGVGSVVYVDLVVRPDATGMSCVQLLVLFILMLIIFDFSHQIWKWQVWS